MINISKLELYCLIRQSYARRFALSGLGVYFVDEYSVFLDEGIAPGRFATEKSLKGFVCPRTIFHSHL